MSRTFSSIAFAAIILPLLAASSFAAERDTQSAQVSLRGVNLESTAGAAALHTRLVAASRAVCGVADIRDLQAMADMQSCRAEAIANAAPQLQAAVATARLARSNSEVATR